MRYMIALSLLILSIISAESELDTFLEDNIQKDDSIDAIISQLEIAQGYSNGNSIFLTVLSSDEDEEIKTGDELGIRAGGEPPLKTGEKAGNTIVASTKMRFKIPDMNA
ncbi:unnamed protein product [Blepharisma stoltei]|uniref:Uncharacterized protein n=1 Tax=Blepharisma stoltei TaxID=1481888 RepID=A0AAU9JE21_9CILI|nr:unnamed protein product [Blepharisma stoltei]